MVPAREAALDPTALIRRPRCGGGLTSLTFRPLLDVFYRGGVRTSDVNLDQLKVAAGYIAVTP